MAWRKSSFLILAGVLSFGTLAYSARAGELNVAVAANFTAPMKRIAVLFEEESGHKVKLSFGSSGKLTSQIIQGAPFDVFLAADEKYPELLERKGLADKETRFVYALGKLVLWSAKPGLVGDGGAVLGKDDFGRLAYADPELAPYGLAAKETLKSMGLWDKLQGKLVTGENIGQAYQFVASGNAGVGFIALSQITRDGKVEHGSWWIVPADKYSPIRQCAVRLTAARDKAAAKVFFDYLKRKKTMAIIRSFGYGLP